MILWIPKREWCDQPVRSVQHPMSLICEWDTDARISGVADPAVDSNAMAQKDLKALQGEWVTVHEEFNGEIFDPEKVAAINRRFTFNGDALKVTRTYNNSYGEYHGRFQISPKTREFDWVGAGPGGGGVKWKGIYEVTEDRVKICFNYVENEQTPRPTAFTSRGDVARQRLNFELKRNR